MKRNAVGTFFEVIGVIAFIIGAIVAALNIMTPELTLNRQEEKSYFKEFEDEDLD